MKHSFIIGIITILMVSFLATDGFSKKRKDSVKKLTLQEKVEHDQKMQERRQRLQQRRINDMINNSVRIHKIATQNSENYKRSKKW